MQGKDERVIHLATEIVELMRKHTPRHEAVDAVDVAKVLFRPELGLTDGRQLEIPVNDKQNSRSNDN